MTIIRELKKFKLAIEKTALEMPRETIKNSGDIYRILRQIHIKEGNEFQEFFYVLFLNRCNRLTGYYFASMGGVTGTVADPRLIIKAAALADCSCIIFSHNHPSGSLKPSTQDEDLTQKLKMAASYFDIKVLDHIILSEDDGYYSFADEGIL